MIHGSMRLGRAPSVLALVLAILFPVTAHAITATSVILDWAAPGDNGNSGTAASYQIRYSTAAIGADTTAWWNAATAVANPPAPAVAGTLQSVTLTGLTPAQTYRAILYALDEAGNRSPYSNVAMWTTLADSAIISNITTLTTPGVLAITINWTTDLPATSQVEYGPSPSYGSLTPIDATLVTQHSVTLTSANITNDQTYNFRVRSRTSSGRESISTNRTFKVDAIAPGAITNLTAR